ncbi:MAG: flavodoxin domain-containing protein [Chitinophagaceae bacterium]|jgi:sulfite reductase (NADPH) flavoprotein alpha-component|nr:flavodoxin domain-containing protein [Chitinophagaceae bacterium]
MLEVSKLNVFKSLLNEASHEELVWMNGFLAGIIAAGTPLVEQAATPAKPVKITLAYGTETGNAKSLATKFAVVAKQKGVQAKPVSFDQYRLSDLQKEEIFIIIISTQGDGEPPVAAKKFYDAIHDASLNLPKLKYGVLALGDSSYPLFCQTGKEVDAQLNLRGAQRIINLETCDADYEDAANNWFQKLITILNTSAGSVSAVTLAAPKKNAGKKIYNGTVLTNINLNDKGSEKQTHHIEISAEEPVYEPGDAIGIVPENAPALVENILALTEADSSKIIAWRRETDTIANLLSSKIQLTHLHERVVKQYAKIVQQDIPETKIDLINLLKIYPVKDAAEFEQVLDILEPIAPRLYSLSSSPAAHGDEVHITVALDKFVVNEEEKHGLCSDYLIGLAEGTPVNFYVHQNKLFRLPAAAEDAIMIGPGTGIAPFRSFLFERDARGDTGRNWLFFGDRHFVSDFLYQTEIQSFLDTGILTKFNGAFSRDQAEKIYVQHRMLAHADELFDWIENGANIYICGAKEPMSIDVDNTLINIIANKKNITTEAATQYLQGLQEAGKYHKDVY